MLSTRLANAHELLKLLNEQSQLLEERLSISPIQLSMPTDGKGARIKVSVLPQDVAKVPPSIELNIAGEKLEIRLEASGDYQDYTIQGFGYSQTI